MAFVRTVALALTLFAVACVESQPAPNLHAQGQISYGRRLYLIDASQATPRENRCTKFGNAVRVGTSTIVRPVEGFGTEDIPLTEPHNCFIPVVPKTLKVDQFEVTNEQFQLCVDSGVCARPDPSDASKSQVCSDEDDFDLCPVAEMPFSEAERFCQYIGRRLPTMFEHIAMRQANFADTSTPSGMLPFVNGTMPPGPCEDGLINSPICNAVRPSPVGTASRDRVDGIGGTPIFDLTGSMTEWAADGFPNARGNATGFPWFCFADLPPENKNPPTCPVVAGERLPCAYADYAPEGFAYGTYPLCITLIQEQTDGNGAFTGQIGALAGGGVIDDDANLRTVGAFARRVEPARRDDNAQLGYGFRCVDDFPTSTVAPTIVEIRTDDMP